MFQLHAQYDRDNDEYFAHRLIQAFDLAQFIRVTAASADLCVLAGDLNVETEDLCLQIILHYARLTDAMTKAGHACMSTFECSRNSYTRLEKIKLLSQGQRIDHILYRSGPWIQVELTSHDYSFQERIPGRDISYSDHEAINAVFKLTRKPASELSNCVEDFNFIDCADTRSHLSGLKQSLLRSLDVCSHALAQLRRDRLFYISLILILSTFLALISLFDRHLPFSSVLRSYNIVPVIITLILVFCSLMAFLWNSMEYNGVLCGQSTMKIALRRTMAYGNRVKRGDGTGEGEGGSDSETSGSDREFGSERELRSERYDKHRIRTILNLYPIDKFKLNSLHL
ncbi:hypothetical protein M8J76_001046 [Diaphorina citri]|nr:hypothetical protein M8J76_001046 [Diaphorina citri]